MTEFWEGIFTCATVFVILGGLLIICHGIGLIAMKFRSRRTDKKVLSFVRRVR